MPAKTPWLAALASVFCVALAHADGDVHTRLIASTCLSCHGASGKSQSDIPSLAGIDKARFVKQMQDFKSGARPASVMKRHASGYTDAEFIAMGEYFAALKP
jgi:cytochrome c553